MIILLVEDDPAQLEPLHAALSQAGHIVDAIEDGETAQWLMSEKDYDLLILDWMLPTISGLACVASTGSQENCSRDAHRQRYHLDKVTGLDAGADDYLETSRSCRTPRVRALGRRSPCGKRDTAHGRFKTPSDKSDRERAQVANCQSVSFR